MSDLYGALEDARLRRLAQEQNATRNASVVLTYDTTGVGEQTTTAALDFGLSFTEPPVVATGAVALALPDTDRYRYPTISAGVWKWQTTATSNPDQPLYTGAWLFFTVQCDPRTLLRTDGTDQAYWAENTRQSQARLANTAPNTADYYTARNELQRVQSQLAEALLAKDLQDNPPRVTIRHHLTFSGLGSQAYSFDQAFTAPVTPVPVTFW